MSRHLGSSAPLMKVCGASSGLSHEQLRRVTESHLGSAPTSRTKDFSGNFYASGSLQERVNEAKSSCTVLSSVYRYKAGTVRGRRPPAEMVFFFQDDLASA